MRRIATTILAGCALIGQAHAFDAMLAPDETFVCTPAVGRNIIQVDIFPQNNLLTITRLAGNVERYAITHWQGKKIAIGGQMIFYVDAEVKVQDTDLVMHRYDNGAWAFHETIAGASTNGGYWCS